MKRIISIVCVAFMVLTSCSTQKNTGASRTFHEMKTYHNIYFNGMITFRDGLDQMAKANEDDFSQILNLYPVSNHKAAAASASKMDATIEKCRKCIKLHSIHVKPKKIDAKKKSHDEKYRRWLEQKEFNDQMYRAWLLLAQSEFYKGEFLESVGTFNYVSRLYEGDKNIGALCQLWVARAYGEMGWIYEAEDLLDKVNVDDLSRKNQPFYSAVSADINLKAGHLKEALPFVKVARENESRKAYLPRFEFVLGELYQREGQKNSAMSAFKRVSKMHSKDVTLDFNARVRYLQLQGDTTKAIKQLRRMAKMYKYREDLDQIYGAIGNIYLMNGDTAKALSSYQLAIENSKKNGLQKASVLLTAGDLYYDRQQYQQASPCYNELVQIISNEHPQYKRAQKRSEVLQELVVELNAVQLQDSLQYLSTLSEEEQLAIVEKIIADLIEKEKNDSVLAAQQAREAELEAEGGGLQSVNTRNMLGGGGGDESWYFYNAQLMKVGKQDFARKWGNRPLEDNWRRQSKAMVSSLMEQAPEDEETKVLEQLAADTALAWEDENFDTPLVDETDIHKPQYYLQQIPKTPNDFDASNKQIASALYNMVSIYRDKMDNQALSTATFEEFLRRFPQDERALDLYYMQYLTALKNHDSTQVEACRQAILSLYPDSRQAAIVGNPEYAASMQRMAAEQDSLYDATYKAYTSANYAKVKSNKQYAETNYPMTPLMPQFLFLNSIAVAKTEGQEAFVEQLQDLVSRYSESQLGAVAKNMLAMMGQGMTSQKGGTASTLADQRFTADSMEQSMEIREDVQFSAERKEASLVCVVLPQDEPTINNMLYQVALFNFSQFLIKDFDIRALPVFLINRGALLISGFDSIDEAEWYIDLAQDNADLNGALTAAQAIVLPISEKNFQLLGNPFTLDDYLQFMQDQHPRK